MLTKMFRVLILTLISALRVQSVFIHQLGGQWTAIGEYDSNTISVNATVPGGIYSDLMEAEEIDNIFYGYNDQEYIWVSLTNWTYIKEFEVPENLSAQNNINLVFEGVDTFATITLNDKEVGKTENMFVKYVFPIRDLLKAGTNTLKLDFTSSVIEAENLAESEDYEIPPSCTPYEYRGVCHVNEIRKMQASFAWDWGPSFPSTGIWKQVYLEGFTNSVIENIVTKPIKQDDQWILPLKVYFSENLKNSVGGILIWELVSQDGVSVLNNQTEINITPNEFGEYLWTSTLQIDTDVELWWPNDYGVPYLYNLKVTLQDDSSNENITSSKLVQVGFRTVELVQDPTEKGLTFYFVVNDIPIFAKGANEIPLSVLPEIGQDSALIRKLLTSVRDTHMNMIRVWGGGVYESDEFYKLADEFGILIWQDFMFACALYPTRPEFLSTVIDEVRHQVKRLHSHPSIAIWAGNNENELALMQNWYNVSSQLELYKADYVKLYVDTVKTELLRITENEALFITSSPTNGKESEDENYLATYPSSPFFGDMHFYEYESDNWDPSIFPIPRFASEYGYQSLPSVESWLTCTESVDDLQPDGDFMNQRQHHPGGTDQNNLLITHQLNLPNFQPHDKYIDTYIYYSQLVQAMAVKIETEHYRSFMGRVDGNDQGNTMGALYWQLNDVWVAPTWSGIDFTGRWKMLQYFVQDFFNPILLTPQINYKNRTAAVFVVTDPIPGFVETDASILWHVFNYDAVSQPLQTITPVTLVPGKSVLAVEIDLDETLEAAGCGDPAVAFDNCFLYFHLLNANLTQVLAPTNFLFPGKLKHAKIQPSTAKISAISATEESNIFDVSVDVEGMSYFLWLDSHDIQGRFSMNGWIQFGTSHVATTTVQFIADSDSLTVEELQNSVTVTHLAEKMNIV